MWMVLAACSEQKFSQLTQEDLFQQERLNTVDVLLVVDNSCSMIEEQQKLGSNFDTFIQFFDDADVDWQIGVITTDTVQDQFKGRLIGGDDEIILLDAEDRTVDEVRYDYSWPVASGTVFALDMTWASATDNDSLDHWCVEASGTPGTANAGCGGTGEGADARYGEVIVTEFLADPDGVIDEVGEWVELTNISDADVDLSGFALVDAGRNWFDIPDGVAIAAGQSLVFGRSADTTPGAIAMGSAFTLNNHDLFLNQDTEGPSEIFAEIVAQGITGSGIEMGLEAARLAVTEPLVTTENAGFLREDANLSILIVSDEEDSSPDPVDDYLNDFVAVKGEEAYRDHSLMNLSGVVGDAPPEFEGEPSCSSDSGYATYGSRYVYAATRTSGLLDSICSDDFSPIVEKLGLTLSGLQADFALSRVPDLDSLEVSIHSEPTEESKLKDLTIDVDFTYVEESNSLHFEYDQVPPSETYINAEYRIQSGT